MLTQEAPDILQAFVTTVPSQDFGRGALCGKGEGESLTGQLAGKIHPSLLFHFLLQAHNMVYSTQTNTSGKSSLSFWKTSRCACLIQG